jgi:hypothetical protein
MKFYLNQLQALWLKRVLFMLRRYVITFLAIFGPFLFILFTYSVMPSSTSLLSGAVSSLFNQEQNTKSIDLSVDFYGKRPFRVPIELKSLESAGNENATNAFGKFVESYFQTKTRHTKVERIPQEQNLNKYVLEKRIETFKNTIRDYLFGFVFEFGSKLENARIYINSMAYHSNGVGLNELNSLLLAYYTNKTEFRVRNAPIRAKSEFDVDLKSIDFSFMNCIETLPFSTLDFQFGLIVAFIISLTCINITRERVNRSKTLQIMSGTSNFMYWTSNYTFDLFIYLINIGSVIGLIRFLAEMGASAPDRTDHVLLGLPENDSLSLLILFGLLTLNSLSWATFAYIWSGLFKSEIVAFATLFILLAVATFFDMLFAFVYFVNLIANIEGKGELYLKLTRIVLAILFPNVAAKRAVFNLKMRSDNRCDRLFETYDHDSRIKSMRLFLNFFGFLTKLIDFYQ